MKQAAFPSPLPGGGNTANMIFYPIAVHVLIPKDPPDD